MNHCTELGNPAERRRGTFMWDTTDNVTVLTGETAEGLAINIEPSSAVRGFNQMI